LLCSLLFFLILPHSFRAQQFNFKNYSVDDGLSQSEINTIFEDSRGYLWIGTSGGGLNRFDGKEFKVYEQRDGVCGQIITAISEDNEKNILVGTEFNELCKFDGSIFQSINPPSTKEFKGGPVRFIVTDDNNNTIFAKDQQLLLHSAGKYQVLNERSAHPDSVHIQCFKKDSRNIIWIGTNSGLLVLKNQTLVRVIDAPLLQKMNIISLTEDVNGNIWAADEAGNLKKIRIKGPSHYQVEAIAVDSIRLPERTTLTSIHIDQNNQLWIGTSNKGLFKFASGTLSHFDQRSGLPVENINTIFEDRSGNLWFGTSGGGLVKFTSQAFSYYDNVPGLNQPDIFAMTADHSGNIWVGTQLHGLYRFDGKVSQDMTAASGVGEREIRSLFTDSRNRIWIGTNDGMFIHENGRFRKYQQEGCTNIRSVFEDNSGNIWIGTRGQYAFIDNGKTVVQLGRSQGLGNDNVYSFAQYKNGDIWIGTGNGIYVYSDGSIRKHLTDGLCNTYAGSMIKDQSGNIWVGTDNCVAFYDGSVFRSLAQKDGLASGTVYLLNGGGREIWVGTNKGLDKISLKESGEPESIRNYGKAEGFKGIECNSRATCTDQEGRLWFGTIKGAIRFDPREELLRKREQPQVHLTGLKLFYEARDLTSNCSGLSHWYCMPENLVLPYNKNHITIEFAAISKSFPDDILYSFMLEGFDEDWTPPSKSASATYSNLSAGTYNFRVMAINKDGMKAQAESFQFTIKPPFWTTWWFIAFCVLGVILFIYLYNEYRKRKHVLYLERLERIIKERTAEIIRQRDENEILLKEVHHRVKNNLQIINSLINIQSEYVSDERSAELFREIRNRIRTISLVHEKLYKSEDYGNINVKEYIHMLVENLIDTYSINKNIDLKLDLEVQHFNLNTIIPLGLLLNEIISNSFKYAFEGIEEGVIEITLHKSNIAEEYTIIIGDNGKGFSDELFNSSSPTLGLELVRILSSQLNGTIEKIQKPGTYYILKFKPLKN
jgi:two-component sensor histidine kinase/ligand-binding sensor domain-containing protein